MTQKREKLACAWKFMIKTALNAGIKTEKKYNIIWLCERNVDIVPYTEFKRFQPTICFSHDKSYFSLIVKVLFHVNVDGEAEDKRVEKKEVKNWL